MKPSEYKRLCNEMGEDPIVAGRKIGLEVRTAYRYPAGDSRIREVVARLLRYARRNNVPLDEFEKEASK